MKTNRIAGFAILAGMIAMPSRAQTAAELLQKGIYTQETAGDLDGAITIYRQIVNSGNSPRDVAAQAQYRLAQSLLQKGDLANGATEFSNLARNYADYGKLISSLAAQARASYMNPSGNRELEQRVQAVLDRMKATDDGDTRVGSAAPDKSLLSESLMQIDRGEYTRARVLLNSLINSYPNSEYVARAKLGIIQSWMREGGPQGIAQAQAEFKDFTRFYPELAAAAGRGGRGPAAARTPGDPAALEGAIRALKAQEQAKSSGGSVSPEEESRIAAALSKLELVARDAELHSGPGGRGGKTPASFVDPLLASMTFDANSPVTVKGTLFKQTMEVPGGSISVDPMDGTGRRYTFLTSGPAELAKQGMTKVSLRIGDQVTITGALASGGQTLSDGTVAARADTITNADGRKLFDRALLKGEVIVEPGENEIRLVRSDGNFIGLPIQWRQR